jgi:hypothetical protein
MDLHPEDLRAVTLFCALQDTWLALVVTLASE